ncbi:MAG: acyl carrier protein [Gammaproteobacteria bacterium]
MTNNVETILGDVIKLLNQFVKQDIEITESNAESLHLMRDLELDSVMVMELMMELEDHFDISIPLNSLPDVNTVSDLATEIAKLKNQ